MSYREKECPTCGALHKKRGPYCCRSCGNSRVHSEEHKQLLSRRQTEHLMSGTDQAEMQKWMLNNHDAPEPVLPPTPTIADNQFIADGDLWTMD